VIAVNDRLFSLGRAGGPTHWHSRSCPIPHEAEGGEKVEVCLQVPGDLLMLALFLAVDWACCRVLAWRLSNTLDSHFCVEALKVAFAQYGGPEIFNADQGAQFTSQTFPQALKDAKIIISMCP